MMSHRSEFAWIGFEDSQRNIEALKEEVLKAEKKLKNVRKTFHCTVSSGKIENHVSPNSFTFNQNWSKRKKMIQRSKMELHKVLKPRAKTSVKNAFDALEGEKVTLDKSDPSPSYEDQPKAYPTQSQDPKELKKRLIESAINNVMSRISSTENSTSSNSNLVKESSSDGTSTLITETYQNIDKKLKDVINRCEIRKLSKASRVSSALQSDEDVNVEMSDYMNTEVKVIASSPMTQQPIKSVNGIEWRIPSAKNIHPHSASTSSANGFQKLKQIIDQQRKRHEQLLNSEVDDNIFTATNSKNQQTQTMNGVQPKINLLEPEVRDSENKEESPDGEEVQIKPPPVRKICTVTTFPEYKGFSACGNMAASSGNLPPKKNVMYSHAKSLASPKRFRRIVKCSEDLGSASCWKKQWQSVPKVSTRVSQGIVKQGKDEETSNSESSESDEQRVSEDMPVKENLQNTIDLTESPKKSVTVVLLDDNVTSETTSKHDLDSEEKENTSPVKKICKSSKRKAKMSFEQKCVYQKIRHYDVNKVRNYIEKKKAERKRRRLEETKKQKQEVENKKLQLQQLYEYQKRNINGAPRTRLLTPIKLPIGRASAQRVSHLYEIPKTVDTHPPSRAVPSRRDINPANFIAPKETLETSLFTSSGNAKFFQKLSSPVREQCHTQLASDSVEQAMSVSTSEHRSNDPAPDHFYPVENETEAKVKFLGDSIEPHSTRLKEVATSSKGSVLSFSKGENASGSLTLNSSLNLSFNVNDAELQMVHLEKECGIIFRTEQSKTLKNLAQSVKNQVDDLTKQLEGFLRTKKWVEESSSPLKRKPGSSGITQAKVFSTFRTSKKSIDFSDVLKLDESVKSFQERITGIGDTTALYSRITGKKYLAEAENEQEDTSKSDQEPIRHNEVDAVSIESSLTQHSLKSSTERGKADFKAHDGDFLHSRFRSGKDESSGNGALEQSRESNELPIYHPDPFNFINTWNKKPLRIPQFSKEISTQEMSLQSSSPSLRPSSSQKTTSSIEEKAYSSDFEESDHINETVRHLTSHDLKSPASHKIAVVASSEETDSQTTSKVRHSTPVERGNNISDSLVVSSVYSYAVSDESTLKDSDLRSKVMSQSDSSISEIVSVVENSKEVTPEEKSSSPSFKDKKGSSDSGSNKLEKFVQNSRDSVTKFAHNLVDRAPFDSKPELMQSDIQEDACSLKSTVPSDAKSIEEMLPSAHEISSVLSVDGASALTSPVESDLTKKSNNNSPVTSLNNASPVTSVREASPVMSANKPSPVSSVSEASSILFNNEASPAASVAELSSCTTANSSEWEFSAPANIHISRKPDVAAIVHDQKNVFDTKSYNVMEHFAEDNGADPVRLQPSITFSGVANEDIYQMQRFGEFHQEQFIHPHIVARVATEAATAAATSAVIAVLETQKALLTKKQILAISERESNSPGQGSAVTHYSSDFESTNSQKSSSDPSQKGSGKSKPSIPDEAVSIASFNNLENTPLVEMAESTKVDGSLSHSKSSDHSLVHTEEIADDSQGGHHSRSNKRKISGNLSSPSPASLSDNDSMFSATVVTSNTSISSLSHHSESLQSLNSDDAFAQLTLDVVRRMTYDEERRAGQQLSLLRFQENMLVENARAEMKWLELLKKKLREKGAEHKVSAIKKRQKDLILRLRQERIQLRCMQEAYRSMCEKHRVLLADKKKFLNEPSSLAYQILHKKEKSLSGKRLSKESLKSGGQPQSSSSSTPSIATDDEAYSINKIETTPEIPEVLELPKSMTSNSSQESVIETQASGSTKSPQLSVSKSEAASNVMPSVTNQEKVSSQSMESALQGLKKLEASKRHLTKREQRIGQRRKHVESLLQWQMKLDSEEMAIRELEQRALELVDHSKKKAKYYVSSSISTTPNENQPILTKPDLDNPEDIAIPTQGSNTSELVTTETLNNKPLSSESKPNSSIPEESLQSYVTLEGSVEEDIAMEKQSSNNLDVSSNAKSSTSTIAEEDINKGSESSIRTLGGSVQSPNGADIVSEEIPSVLSVSPKDKSSSDMYSESFESTVSNKTPSSSNKSSLQKNSGSQCGTKKNRNINIRLPLMPRNRRHDSSGSDDSYTISHSETASDQSDIEGRIHALAEELRRRKAEAEKLKRDHKRHYREQLKEKELSLQKQLEAYNQYIQQTRTELEHQLESAAAPTHGTDPSAGGGVKPQIKSPRIEHGGESRRLRKQSALSPPEALPLEKKAIDKSSNHDSPDSSILSNLSLTKGRAISLIKKAALESKEIPFSNKIQATKDTTESNSNSNTTSNIVTEISSQESQSTTEAIESSDTFVSESSKSKQETNATPKRDDSRKPDSPQNEADGSEDATVSEKSMSSSISNKTLQNVSNNSLESESVVEEHLASNGGSVEEELESGNISGNFECDGSDGCPTPPKQKPADQTFVVDESSVLLDHKQKLEDNAFGMGHLYKSESSIDNTKLLGQKSEVFVTNVTCHLATSLLDDSIDVMLRMSGKCSMTLKAPTPVKPDTDVSPKAQAILSAVENRMVKITNSILNKCLDEAIATIMGILKSTEKGLSRQARVSSEKLAHPNSNSLKRDEPPNGKIKSIFPSDDLHKKHVKFAELSPIDDFIGSQAEFTKPNFSIVTGEAYTESLFNKQTDWFTEGFESSKEDSYLQQLEQQILLQQYPYYYRKIPNKPPPPYTPPSATEKSVSAKTGKQKSAKLADGIVSVKDNIDPIVENVVDVIIEGKIQGIAIEDIAAPNVLTAAEVLQLTSPSQMTFMIFVFDLVKELVVNLFVEKEEELDPWVRPRKLTPKPLFTTNKTKMVSILQKEVQKLLKISPGYIQPEPRRNQSLRSAMKLGRKERDFVDTILISELKEEEPDWVNYDQDELTVKNQIAESVLDHVMDDTVKVFLAMLKVNR